MEVMVSFDNRLSFCLLSTNVFMIRLFFMCHRFLCTRRRQDKEENAKVVPEKLEKSRLLMVRDSMGHSAYYNLQSTIVSHHKVTQSQQVIMI
jgi:hypothetical protein